MATIPGAIIASQNLSTLAVFGGDKPLCEGPRVLPILGISFANIERYELDYTNQMATGRISMVQSVWIDASNLGNGPGPIMVLFVGIGQRILANPRTQGFYPVMAAVPFRVVIECHAGGLADIIFANYVIPPAVWASQAI